MDTSKIKSFWERPEGGFGMGTLIALGAICGYAILKNIDTLIALAQNTLYFGFLCGAIFLIVSLLMNNKFRWLIASAFQSAIRTIASIWIAVDPIGILKNYLEEMKDRLKKIERYISQLAGQIGKVKNDINNRETNAQKHIQAAAAAKKLGEMEHAALCGNMAAREMDYANRRKASLQKMEATLDILSRMKKNLNFLYLDTEHQVTILADEYAAVKAADKAIKGAQQLIEGDDAKAIFEQTCQYITDEIGTKLGEMDRFLEQAHGPLTSMNIANEVFNEKGLEMLANWEKTGLLSYQSGSLRNPQPKIRVATSASQPSEEEIEEEINNTNNTFSKIFTKK